MQKYTHPKEPGGQSSQHPRSSPSSHSSQSPQYHKPASSISTQSTKKYRRHAENMVRISLSISPALLKRIDEAAEQDYTTRSDIIRIAALWYLRPQGRDFDAADPDAILKTLKHRKAIVAMNKTFKDITL